MVSSNPPKKAGMKAPSTIKSEGFFWLTLFLGALLIAIAVSNVVGVKRAASVIARGEAQRLLEELRREQQRVLEPLGKTELESFAAQYEGVSYLALLGRDGHVLEHWGTSSFNRPLRPGAQLERSGSRFRIADRPAEIGRSDPPPRRPPRFGGQRQDRPPPRSAGRPDEPRRRPNFVIEFEPALSTALERDATRSLILSVVAGLLFLAGSIFFRRLQKERDVLQQNRLDEARLRALGTMSGVLAHELRNPLTSLKGHAQLLAEGLANDEKNLRRVERVLMEATRLEELCTDLLEFVRQGPLDLSTAEVEAVLKMAIDRIGHPIVLDTAKAPHHWVLDAGRIEQVLVNLIDNAVAASNDSSEITVRAEGAGANLTISVADRGRGMTDEQLQQAFEPFFTTRAEGTGLGLFVCRRIVEMHGGRLEARNRAERGAVCTVHLPKPEVS